MASNSGVAFLLLFGIFLIKFSIASQNNYFGFDSFPEYPFQISFLQWLQLSNMTLSQFSSRSIEGHHLNQLARAQTLIIGLVKDICS